MRRFEYYIVDVFTNERYTGNPTAVVLDADGLDDAHLRAVAREFNLSETTFVLQPPSAAAAIALRWFTPQTEVALCGHGTIGAVHALIHNGRCGTLVEEPGTILPIHTRQHALTVRCQALPPKDGSGFLVWLDLPPPQLIAHALSPGLWGELLGVPKDQFDLARPSMRTGDDDVLIFVKGLTPLLEACPDFPALAKHCRGQRLRGVCLATTQALSGMTDVQSRFFAPAVGIDEDPVTGSVHGPLAAYLVNTGHVSMMGDHALLHCIQAQAGGCAGLVRAVVRHGPERDLAVRIAGQCAVSMHGELYA